LTDIRFESAVPQFAVADVVRTAEYYRDVLGFEISGYWNGESAGMDTEPPPLFGIVRRGDVEVFFNRAGQPPVRSEEAPDAYFHITGLDAFAAKLRTTGADILDGPEDRVYGQREIVVRDCNGLILVFGEATR
jgi:catechol 2,3-dioxygenase-like lactoylglutathione lyase family enzyme